MGVIASPQSAPLPLARTDSSPHLRDFNDELTDKGFIISQVDKLNNGN